jgi:hypothetical protein
LADDTGEISRFPQCSVPTLIAETMRWHLEAATPEVGVWLPTNGGGSASLFPLLFPVAALTVQRLENGTIAAQTRGIT